MNFLRKLNFTVHVIIQIQLLKRLIHIENRLLRTENGSHFYYVDVLSSRLK